MPRPSPFGKDSLLLEGICPQKSAHIPAHVAIRIVDGIGGGLSNDLHSGKDSLLLSISLNTFRFRDYFELAFGPKCK